MFQLHVAIITEVIENLKWKLLESYL